MNLQGINLSELPAYKLMVLLAVAQYDEFIWHGDDRLTAVRGVVNFMRRIMTDPVLTYQAAAYLNIRCNSPQLPDDTVRQLVNEPPSKLYPWREQQPLSPAYVLAADYPVWPPTT